MPSFEAAELTLENGHLSEHGLVNPTAIYPTNVAGTLECIVDQAKLLHTQLYATDAIVPRLPTHHPRQIEDLASGIGSCNNMEQRNKRTRKGHEDDNTLTTAVGSRDNTNTCSIDDFGFTPSNSIDRSPENENTSLNGGGGSRQVTMIDNHDYACHSIRSQPQREMCGEEDRRVTEGAAFRSNVSTKKSRSAAIHNQSERKRRDKINQKMRTLQKLVPNSSKTDKASMLDEVIEYLKQLQALVGMVSKMGGMMMPIGTHRFQMALLAQITQMAQMSSMGIMDLSTLSRVGQPMSVSPMFPASTCMPMMGCWVPSGACMLQPAGGVAPDPFSQFAVCPPQQPMTMDAHQRMAAALSQQMFQDSQPPNQN